jgi:hypothetical protein
MIRNEPLFGASDFIELKEGKFKKERKKCFWSGFTVCLRERERDYQQPRANVGI